MRICAISSFIFTGFSNRARDKGRVNRKEQAANRATGSRDLAFVRRAWLRMRNWVRSQPVFGSLVVNAIYWSLRFINRTNPFVQGSHVPDEVYARHAPMIITMWHGQHLMAPFMAPKGARLVAMLSRSADAEINARIIEKFGHDTIRGSGGRESRRALEKGGARALIGLKRALDNGSTVVMIADISKSTARQAGMGVILLAKMSGRPIVAAAYASSRRRVLEKTWDKTTVSLPFGRAAAIAAEPLFVPRDASADQLEELRQELTRRLNQSGEQAGALVDGKP